MMSDVFLFELVHMYVLVIPTFICPVLGVLWATTFVFEGIGLSGFARFLLYPGATLEPEMLRFRFRFRVRVREAFPCSHMSRNGWSGQNVLQIRLILSLASTDLA